MPRGDYDFIRDFSSYGSVNKAWYAELQRVDYFWLDLIVDPPEPIKQLNFLSSYLADLKRKVEDNLENRFIYFICSRTKIRFDIQKKPRFNFFTGNLKINLIVGKDKKESVKIKIIDESGKIFKPIFEINDKFICFINNAGGSTTFSVHDLLYYNCINLGHPTKVHYVGITKNPDTRPLNRQHRGVADTLYRVSNEENDFFILVNLFKITTLAPNHGCQVEFFISNAMTNEISVDKEGYLIEKSFIAYFDSIIQREENSHERASLASLLNKIKSDSKIHKILFDYGTDQGSEYFNICSEKVGAAERHLFFCYLNDDGVVIERLENDSKARQFIRDPFGLGSDVSD